MPSASIGPWPRREDPPWAALEGAGRTAFALGMYRLADDYLTRAVSSPVAARFPENQKTTDRDMLATAAHVLMLYPGFDLAPRARAERVLAIRKIARARLTSLRRLHLSARHRHWPLVSRWDQLPSEILLAGLEQKPDLEQTILQLAYDTETATAQVCGAPTGDDALLLRIARNPAAVEQE